MSPKFKYLYGPVPSWRLGRSLGIDPLSQEEKICSFDCSYCQLGVTRVFSAERKVFVPTEDILEELNALPPVEIDYYTLSGRGEPTLAVNLGDILRGIKARPGRKTAVLTNSSLLSREDVRADLGEADFVAVKLDAPSDDAFQKVNRPAAGVSHPAVLEGIRRFRRSYGGRFALQIMFVEENKECTAGLVRLARELEPSEVQINTPLRPCAARPLPKEVLAGIAGAFSGLKVFSVYDVKKPEVKSLSDPDTLRRRGKT